MYNFRVREAIECTYKLKWSSKRKIKVFGKSQKLCFNNIRFKSLKYKYERDKKCRTRKQCESGDTDRSSTISGKITQ